MMDAIPRLRETFDVLRASGEEFLGAVVNKTLVGTLLLHRASR